MEIKTYEFRLSSTEKKTINGQNLGIIRGYASTYDLDRDNDVIAPGAFAQTLADHKQRNDRQIRMLFQHDRENLIGGFPPGLAKEDDKGLFVEGHVNLDVQRGAEAFALAAQGVLSDLSIGFIPSDVEFNVETEIRKINTVDLREISLVDEPANMNATIDVVQAKAVVPEETEAPRSMADLITDALIKHTCDQIIKLTRIQK